MAIVQRHDDKPILQHWLQNIRNEIFGPDVTAIEHYQTESRQADKANIGWVWVARGGELAGGGMR